MKLAPAFLFVAYVLTPGSLAEDFALLVKTADPNVAYGVLAAFEKVQQLDELEVGSHHVILVDDAGEVSVVRGQGDVGLLRLEANPSSLLEIFAEDLQQARAMLTMVASMSAPQSGDPQAVPNLINALFEFPKQVEKLAVAVNGDPDHAMDAAFDLTPRADTGFASFVDALVANKKGAPQVGGDNSLIRISGALDAAACAKVIGPLNSLLALTGAGSQSEVLSKWLQYLDGTFGFSIAGEADTALVAGTRDPQALGSFLYSDAYVNFLQGIYESNTEMESELTAKAISHRGVDLYRHHLTMANPAMASQNPLMASGEMDQYIGLAGDTMVATLLGGTEASAKALVDLALDKKIEYRPLADGAVLAIDVSLAKIVASTGGDPAAEGVPQALNATIGRQGNALHIGLRVH